MSKYDIKDLQRVELNMLEAFIHVCQQLKLNYFVIGGTLLGAVRHEGFIPWDDDIDIGMSRNDYKIFLKEGQKYFNSKYFIQTIDTDSEYLMGFSKIRDCSTTMIESSVKERKINHGVYIDVFPLDGVSNSKLLEKARKILLSLYQIKINSFFYKEQKVDKIKFKSKYAEKISNLITIRKTSKDILYEINKIASKYDFDESLVVGNYFGAWGEKEFYPKEYLGKGTILKFEHLEVKTPENYDLYLNQVYGDYMQLPPIEKQKSHHGIEIIDLNSAYTNYII